MKRSFEGERRPKSSDPFDAGRISGYYDGDYPPWLQAELGDLIPGEVLEEFGEWQRTAINGAYLHIDPEMLPLVRIRLEKLGYELESGCTLAFW